MRDFRAAIAQVSAELRNKEKNIEKIERSAEEAREIGAELLIFPELFLTGYNIRNGLFRLAEETEGNSVDRISKLAEENGMHIIFGMPEREGERIYNSAVLLSPKGERSVYRKLMFPNFGPFEEGLYFTPGNELPVFDTELGKIGMEICYDLFYPEITKTYAGKGAEIIVNISGSPSISRSLFEKVLLARAIENGTYTLFSNNIGSQIGLVFWGGSRIISPRGEIMAAGEAYEKGMVVADLKSDDLRLARQYRPTFRDTRPDILKQMYEAWESH